MVEFFASGFECRISRGKRQKIEIQMEIRNRKKQLRRKQKKLEETKELEGENQKESIEG